MRVWNGIQLAFTAIGGGIGWFVGGVDGVLIALIAMVAIDYLTGVMCAVVDKKLSSEVGARGIFKKVLIFALVGVAHMIDSQVIGTGSTLRTAVIFFYLSNEGISIVENAARLGVPVPDKLRDILAQLAKKGDKSDAE
jgi:toxin secretion/phage lysis holin